MNYSENEIKKVKENRANFYKLLNAFIASKVEDNDGIYTSAKLLDEVRYSKDAAVKELKDAYRNITLPFGGPMYRDFVDYSDRYWNNVNRAAELGGFVIQQASNMRKAFVSEQLAETGVDVNNY